MIHRHHRPLLTLVMNRFRRTPRTRPCRVTRHTHRLSSFPSSSFILVVLALRHDIRFSCIRPRHGVICPRHMRTRYGVVRLGCTHFSSFILVVFVVRPRYPHPRHVVCAFVRSLPALTEIPLLQAPLSFSLEFGFLPLRTCHRPTPTRHRPSSHRLVSSESSSFHRPHMHVFDLVSILAAISHVLANPPHGSKQSAKVVARETSLKLLSMGKTFHDNEKVADECQSPPFMFLFHTSDRPEIVELRAPISAISVRFFKLSVPQFRWFSPSLHLICPSSVPASSDLIHTSHHHISCSSSWFLHHSSSLVHLHELNVHAPSTGATIRHAVVLFNVGHIIISSRSSPSYSLSSLSSLPAFCWHLVFSSPQPSLPASWLYHPSPVSHYIDIFFLFTSFLAASLYA